MNAFFAVALLLLACTGIFVLFWRTLAAQVDREADHEAEESTSNPIVEEPIHAPTMDPAVVRNRGSLPPTDRDDLGPPEFTDEEWREVINEANRKTPGGVVDIPLGRRSED